MSGPSRSPRRNILHVTLSWLRYPKLPQQPAGFGLPADLRDDARGPVPATGSRRNQDSGRSRSSYNSNPIALRRKRPAASSKCPASVPEHRGVRSGIAGRVAQVLRVAPVRPPCRCGASKTETSDEDRRLDEKSKHRICPLVGPATCSLPGCDNIMILNAENFAACGNFCAAKLPQKWSAQALGRHHARFAIQEKHQTMHLSKIMPCKLTDGSAAGSPRSNNLPRILDDLMGATATTPLDDANEFSLPQ